MTRNWYTHTPWRALKHSCAHVESAKRFDHEGLHSVAMHKVRVRHCPSTCAQLCFNAQQHLF